LYGQALPIRPTTMKVKEALFSIIGPRIEGALILDCFCGLGGIGLEALSRGAEKATFIEMDRKVAEVTRKNIARLEYNDKAELMLNDFYSAIGRLSKQNRRFDFVFVDPPYRTTDFGLVLPVFSKDDILTKNGLLVIGHPSKVEMEEKLPGVGLVEKRNYGDTTLNFYGSVRD
jgi:16S rRNA (guanine966-N2)-methyltransferase